MGRRLLWVRVVMAVVLLAVTGALALSIARITTLLAVILMLIVTSPLASVHRHAMSIITILVHVEILRHVSMS